MGCRKPPKSSTSTREHHHQPAPMAMAKPWKTSSMISASPKCWIWTPAGRVFAAGSCMISPMASPSASVPTRSASTRDAAHAVVAVDAGRARGRTRVRHRGERHRAALAVGTFSALDDAAVAAPALVELHADRDLPVADVELGEVGADVADGGDAHRLGDGVGGDAEVGGEVGARLDADLRPVERGRRDRRSGMVGMLPHLARRCAAATSATTAVSSPVTSSERPRWPLSLSSQKRMSGNWRARPGSRAPAAAGSPCARPCCT